MSANPALLNPGQPSGAGAPAPEPNPPTPAPSPAQPVSTDMSGQKLTPPQSSPAAPSGAPPVMQKLVEHASKWQALKNVLGGIYGTTTVTKVNPDGSTTDVPVKQKPGGIFKNILAAALLGGAAGQEEHNRNPFSGAAAGAAAGGAAEVRDRRAQYLQQRTKAINDFARQQAMAQQAEKTKLSEEQNQRATQLNKAEIGHYNALTAQAAMARQRDSFLLQEAYGTEGQTRINDILNSGGSYVTAPDGTSVNNLTHDQIRALGAKYPQLHLEALAEQTGVKLGPIDSQTGQPTVEPLFSAVTHPDKVTLSQDTLNQWKKDGVDPSVLNTLKDKKSLDWSQYSALSRLAKSKSLEAIGKETAEAKLAHEHALIHQSNVEASEALARIAKDNLDSEKDRLELQEGRAGKKKQDQIDAATAAWDKASKNNGGDRVTAFRGLSATDQSLILPSLQATEQKLSNDYRAIPKDPLGHPQDQEAAKSIMQQLNAIHDMTSSYLGANNQSAAKQPSGNRAPLPTTGSTQIDAALRQMQAAGLTDDQAEAQIDQAVAAGKLSNDDAARMRQAWGLKAPITGTIYLTNKKTGKQIQVDRSLADKYMKDHPDYALIAPKMPFVSIP